MIDTMKFMESMLRRIFLTNLGFSTGLIGVFISFVLVSTDYGFAYEIATPQCGKLLIFQFLLCSGCFGAAVIFSGSIVFLGLKIISMAAPSSDALNWLDWSILAIIQLSLICLVVGIALSAIFGN